MRPLLEKQLLMFCFVPGTILSVSWENFARHYGKIFRGNSIFPVWDSKAAHHKRSSSQATTGIPGKDFSGINCHKITGRSGTHCGFLFSKNQFSSVFRVGCNCQRWVQTSVEHSLHYNSASVSNLFCESAFQKLPQTLGPL